MLSLGAFDVAVVALYFVAVLGIGAYLKRYASGSEGFFLAGRSVGAWIAGLSFLAANTGSLELMGWAALAYDYGVQAAHWYWIGAIPAMLFLGLVMMPFYYAARAHSVPGYLHVRFGPAARTVSAVSFAIMTLLMSGVNMYSMALVLKVILGWDLHVSLWVGAATVGVYVVLGGLLSAMFSEVLQFVLVWAGAIVVPVLGLIEAGGIDGLRQRIEARLPTAGFLHLWQHTDSFAANPLGVHWTGIVFGLGFVLSFGYWTTDFLVVQRVLVARDLRSARLAPIIAAAFKLVVPAIVVLPGLIGLAVLPARLLPESQAIAAGTSSVNEVLPLLLARYAGPGLLGLGVTALIAGFMSGMAGNVTAFSTVWTFDLYQPLRPARADRHYVRVGRVATAAGLVISLAAAYLVMQFRSIADYVQALFSFFIAPLFGTVSLGMLWRRTSSAGAVSGLVAGTALSIALWIWARLDPHALAVVALSADASSMAETMYRALWSWLTCVVVTIAVSAVTRPRPAAVLDGLVLDRQRAGEGAAHARWFERPGVWAAAVAAVFVAINVVLW